MPTNRDEAAPTYEADVLSSARDNHMWLNAFSCVRPTEETKIAIGEWVLRLLNDQECTLLSSLCREGGILSGLNQRELVVRFNKS